MKCSILWLTVVLVIAAPGAALAYGGPGSVITGLGALLAVAAALLASLLGFIWFPMKRFVRWARQNPRLETDTD